MAERSASVGPWQWQPWLQLWRGRGGLRGERTWWGRGLGEAGALQGDEGPRAGTGARRHGRKYRPLPRAVGGSLPIPRGSRCPGCSDGRGPAGSAV